MYYRNQPILVTGATGLVGSNLIRRLLEQDSNIRATLHDQPPVVVDDRVEYVTTDLTKAEDCRRAVKGCSLVFMCAATTSGAGVLAATPMAHVTPNVLMNTQMLEAAYNAGVSKFLWISSTTSYPPSGSRPVKEEEAFDGEPFDAYYYVGWMKRFTEALCRMYGDKLSKPMTTVVIRPTNIYGPGDDFEPATSHVTAALIRKVVERQDPLEVWGTGDDIRDIIYVDDIVEIIMKATEMTKGYATFNAGLGQAYSVKEILQHILELDGSFCPNIIFNSLKPSMIPVRRVDTSKAADVLGFKARTNLREGLKKTIEWYRYSRNLPRPSGDSSESRSGR